MKVSTIARNTFKEAKRDRVLYLLLFLCHFVFSSVQRFLGLLTVGDRVKL